MMRLGTSRKSCLPRLVGLVIFQLLVKQSQVSHTESVNYV